MTITQPSTLSIPEASALMHIHPKTTLELISTGVIPAGKVGRSYVMLYRDVMAHIERVVIQQTAERMGGNVKREARLTVRPRSAAVKQVEQMGS